MTNKKNKMAQIICVVSSICRWFTPIRRNAKSQSLTGPQALAFKAEMLSHGMADDDSSVEAPR